MSHWALLQAFWYRDSSSVTSVPPLFPPSCDTTQAEIDCGDSCLQDPAAKKKSPAKKTAAKKPAAPKKKTPAKKTPAKTSPSKKTTVTKTAAKKAAAKKATAKKVMCPIPAQFFPSPRLASAMLQNTWPESRSLLGRRGIHLGNGVGNEPKNAFIFARDDREHVADQLTFLPVQAASAKKTIAKKVATKKTTPKKAKK